MSVTSIFAIAQCPAPLTLREQVQAELSSGGDAAAVPSLPAGAQFPPQLPPGYAPYAQASTGMGSMAPPQTSAAPGYGTRSTGALAFPPDTSAAPQPYNSRSRTPTAPRTSGAPPLQPATDHATAVFLAPRALLYS